jgi:hypothetical protein
MKFSVGYEMVGESNFFGNYEADSPNQAIQKCLVQAKQAGINLFEESINPIKAKMSMIAFEINNSKEVVL